MLNVKIVKCQSHPFNLASVFTSLVPFSVWGVILYCITKYFKDGADNSVNTGRVPSVYCTLLWELLILAVTVSSHSKLPWCSFGHRGEIRLLIDFHSHIKGLIYTSCTMYHSFSWEYETKLVFVGGFNFMRGSKALKWTYFWSVHM